MQTKLACLSLAAWLSVSCDKSGTKPKPDDTSSNKPRLENRTDAPAIAQQPAPGQRETPDAIASKPIDAPIIHPVDPSKIRPSGIAPDDASWQTLTAEQMIGKFNSSGIARMPKDVSEKILADAASAASPEDQVHHIMQQSAAWHHINKFKEDDTGIPDHMRKMLLERLFTKHGDSWMNMVPELDEQVAASAKVDELRSNGIPGMSPDESQDLLIKAIGDYGPDYKAILSVANRSARK